MTTEERIKTLAEFLEVETDEINQSSYDENLFEYGNQEYLVLTDEQADEYVEEEIKNSLWAFNTDFIISHCATCDQMSEHEINAVESSLRKVQEECCENANGLVLALIEDLDDFVEDAIMCDGRGHFISHYDGNENELNDYYIYRVN